MKNEYNRKIKIKTLWLSLKHHFFLFFGILATAIVCGTLAATLIVKKEYQSSIKIENQNAVSYVHLNNLSDLCIDKRTVTLLANSLSEKNITHENGESITEKELISGMITPKYRKNGYSITVLFQSRDRTITKPVLDELGSVVLDYAGEIYESFYTHFRVAGEATQPTKISQEKKTFYVFLISGFIFGYFVCLAKEIYDDKIADENDIEDITNDTVLLLRGKGKNDE